MRMRIILTPREGTRPPADFRFLYISYPHTGGGYLKSKPPCQTYIERRGAVSVSSKRKNIPQAKPLGKGKTPVEGRTGALTTYY